MSDTISVHGARQHNLKNIDVVIPKNKLVVITGLSGSGKSSLAFDTIYAEGQRRYVESLSSYARQFLGVMDKPDVDRIDGLSPAISIDQKSTSHNPRSTVGTVTEIYDYLRLLFARVGHPHCPECGRPVSQQTVQQIVDKIVNYPVDQKILILAPVILDRKGSHEQIFDSAHQKGFVRVRVDGVVHELDEAVSLDKNKKHTIEIVVDRLKIVDASTATREETDNFRRRLTDSVEAGLKLGEGFLVVSRLKEAGHKDELFSEHFACVYCGVSMPEIAPRLFSFNSPYGACPVCTGLGSQMVVDPDLVMPNKSLTLEEGAILPWSRTDKSYSWYTSLLKEVGKKNGFSAQVPVGKLKPQNIETIMHGDGRQYSVKMKTRSGREYTYDVVFEGVIPNLARRLKETTSEYVRGEIEKFMTLLPCPACEGKRLKKEALSVKIADRNIADISGLSVTEALAWFEPLSERATQTNRGAGLTRQESEVARPILKEVSSRLRFLNSVGLSYLTLNRSANTLSGGESQRIRLATQIGSGLSGVLYVLDEPSIGLHQRDNNRLLETLRELNNLGNTLLVVEHDEDTILAADHVIDIGPGAGVNGGRLVAQGTPQDIIDNPESVTGQYLSGKKSVPIPGKRRPINPRRMIEVIGAKEHNLQNIDVRFPLGQFICVTGVSGSGKSTLVQEILFKALSQTLNHAKDKPGRHDRIEGMHLIDKVIDIDQSPIGRTPRSNPSTYTGAFTYIRDLYTQLPEARVRGYKAGRFSFNVKGGRCEACRGDGIIKIEMHFLPDVYVTCEACGGKRYNRETLEILYKGHSIAEALDMTVDQAYDFFTNIPAIRQKLKILKDVGLGYVTLGQSATTLSGGEAQRIKLSKELSKRSTGRTVYLLDEPTTGLHFADVEKLLHVLGRLADKGNTVVVIEHNLDVIKTADFLIDLGPDGGDQGGQVVAMGTPEQIAATAASHTGQFLKRVLAAGNRT
ncbi:excinuclease ABC subunit A [Candidatus Wirthbacteria bacterium CG2_30_54_11]|uniref:UvrABC system protein A n=1 Tax=Candidatus Wirthbacteria bacterium CG2_30_54_11 TaxID=1817892 RepID=A0A1J5IRJ2_9BACT|nr:MAG: excinuclease ABC subunit A [Candidatus Wirthbacteria bacterium CG2_30_54_11]